MPSQKGDNIYLLLHSFLININNITNIKENGTCLRKEIDNQTSMRKVKILPLAIMFQGRLHTAPLLFLLPLALNGCAIYVSPNPPPLCVVVRVKLYGLHGIKYLTSPLEVNHQCSNNMNVTHTIVFQKESRFHAFGMFFPCEYP